MVEGGSSLIEVSVTIGDLVGQLLEILEVFLVNLDFFVFVLSQHFILVVIDLASAELPDVLVSHGLALSGGHDLALLELEPHLPIRLVVFVPCESLLLSLLKHLASVSSHSSLSLQPLLTTEVRTRGEGVGLTLAQVTNAVVIVLIAVA
jgi:hypothetical protein